MKKFILGLLCGIGLTASTAVFASSSIQTILFPSILQFHVNGEINKIDGTGDNGVLNYNNKAYVPLRLFAEETGATVDYRAKGVSDPSKPQIDVYLENEQLFTVYDSQGYISIGDVKTNFTSEQKTITGLLKVNKPFTTRSFNLTVKTKDNEYQTQYFSISNPENKALQTGDVREFTAYLIPSNPSNALSDKIESISLASEEETWKESKIEGRPGGTFVQTPFNVTFGVQSSPVEKRDGTNLIYKVGDPISYRFAVSTTEDKSMYLREPLEFSLEIIDVDTQKVVWSGKAPALPKMSFPTWEKYESLVFTWNQYDSKGNPVAPGRYMARVVSPNSIQYSESENANVQPQNLNLNTINRGGQTILIEQ